MFTARTTQAAVTRRAHLLRAGVRVHFAAIAMPSLGSTQEKQSLCVEPSNKWGYDRG